MTNSEREAKRKRAKKVQGLAWNLLDAEKVAVLVPRVAADVLELLEEIQQLTSALETEGGNDE